MPYAFAQDRIACSTSEAALLLELCMVLNRLSHKAFSTALRLKVDPQDMTVAWAEKSGVFSLHDLGSMKLMAEHKSQIVMKAQGLRHAANERSIYLAGVFFELITSIDRQLESARASLALLKTLDRSAAPFEKASAAKARKCTIEKQRLSIQNMQSRRDR
jgi:hypothetical protein